MSIICLKFNKVDKGHLIGFADLLLTKQGMEIRGCQLMQKEGRRWLSMPSKEYQDAAGEKKYYSIVKYQDKEVDKQFQVYAMKAIDEYIQLHSQNTQENKPTNNFDNQVPF